MNSRYNMVNRALGAVSVLCLYGLLPMQQASAQAPYEQKATAANSHGDWTDLSKTNTNKSAIYFETSNWSPDDVYNNHATGVWFDPTHNNWAIFNQDGTAIPLSAQFNVVSVPAGDNVYTHTATATNSAGDYTVLDNSLANNNPNALVWVTPNWNPGDAGGVYDDHNIGVWYTGSNWAIFNQDGAAIPVGASFNVIIAQGSFYPSAYVQTATTSSIDGDTTFLNDSLINGAAGHLLMVTPNWNPGGAGGTYDNKPIGVWYDSGNKEYGIFNQDGSTIPEGASFNVWVLK